MTSFSELATRLGARQHGNTWAAKCPSHGDKKASLSLSVGGEGRILLHCHAGCETADIVQALGISMSDLMPDRERAEPDRGRGFHEVARYPYCNAEGKLLYTKVRFEPKDFRVQWANGTTERVLYRLPELAQAEMDETVLVVEGEKACDRLRGMGFVVVAIGGAGQWRKEFAESLRGREVVLIPDNDEPGLKLMVEAWKSLREVATRTRVLKLHWLPAKGDPWDWVEGGATADAVRLEIGKAKEPDHSDGAGQTAKALTRREIAQAIIDSRKYPFLDLCLDGNPVCRAKAGYVITLSGPTGAGKSSLAIGIADHFARNTGHALILSAELTAAEYGGRQWGMLGGFSWERALNEEGDVDTIEAALPERMEVWARRDATIENACRSLETFRANSGDPALVVIDYGQLLAPQDKDIRFSVGKVWSAAGEMAKKYDAIVFVLARMSRAGSRSARAGERLGADSVDGGAESSMIEYESYITIELGAVGEEEKDGSRPLLISIGKGRMGGGDKVLPANWWPKTGRYRINGPAEPAADHRDKVKSDNREKRMKEVGELVVRTLEASSSPMSQNAIEAVSGVKTKDLSSAIGLLLSSGDICHVERKISGHNLLWVRAKATDAGMGIL